MKPKNSPSYGFPRSRQVDAARPLQQSRPGTAQQKGALLQPKAKHAAAPPAYRPQPVPKVLQRKTDTFAQTQQAQPAHKPTAPPAYRPQPLPRVLQAKKTNAQPPVSAAGRLPVAPQVNRPQPPPKGVPARTPQFKAPAVQRQVSATKPAAPPPRQNRPNVVQRIEIKNDTVVSSFDKSMTISDSQAVLTTAATGTGWTGGHAEFFLEYMGSDNLARLVMIDLRADGNTGQVFINTKDIQKEYKPGYWASFFYSRSVTGTVKMPAKYQAYTIPVSAVQKVFVKVAEWKQKADSGAYKYALTMGSVYSTFSTLASYVSSHQQVRYVNCADFVHEVCAVAGIGHVASADILSRPTSIADKDDRSKEQKYKDVVIDMV